MNTTEKNKLIAEFMDWETIENQSQVWVDTNPKLTEYPLHLLNYIFDDWNILIRVVEKCLIGEAEHTDKKAIELIKNIYDALCNLNKEETFEACVEFIEWFNNQKK